MDTNVTTRQLTALDEPWRRPRVEQVQARLNLELYELEYLALCGMPAEAVGHQYTAYGAWKRRELLERYRAHLVRSSQQHQLRENETNYVIQSLVFRLPDDTVIILFTNKLEVYAASPERAWELGESLRLEFKRPKSVKPHFYLLKRVRTEMEAEFVSLKGREAMPEEQMKLTYGDDIVTWQEGMLKGIREKHCGITILQGPPGTGKTSYLRSLMASHARELRFYFIPSSNFDVLRDSEFVSFWAAQRARFKGKTMVVVLEDAEAVLATRAGDNRAAISNLLNITDGLLGDFLRLHLICTMNCELNDLDPAILRPGRLVARRHFGRIPRERALALAEHLGKDEPRNVQEDYSLAELFNEVEDADAGHAGPKRILGFSAAA